MVFCIFQKYVDGDHLNAMLLMFAKVLYKLNLSFFYIIKFVIQNYVYNLYC